MLMTSARAAVWIAVSDGGADYAAVADSIRSELQRGDGGLEVVVQPWGEMTQGLPSQVSLIVCVGSPACSGLAEASGRIGRVPVVATLLPRAAFEVQRKRWTGPSTAVVLDQPPARQIALLRYAFPHFRRIGVLLGPDSQQLQQGLDRAAVEQGVQLNAYRANGESSLYPALQRLLEENEVLLAIPDAAVFNGGSIQNVLLASYRQKVPMMGFSPAYVRAGALLALYSTPAQLSTQTVRVVRGMLAGSGVPPVQGPMDFVVGVNANVSRSLGYRLSEDALRIQLLNREGM
jgi:ABC-type uncharacterized transport system substrate-binding protein